MRRLRHVPATSVEPWPGRFFKHWPDLRDVLVSNGERGLWSFGDFSRKKLSVSWTQVHTAAAYSPWQKGRVVQSIATIKEVAGKTLLATPTDGWECHVSRQLRRRPRTEPKGREVGHTSPIDTSFRPANEGLRRTDGTRGGRSPSETFDHPGVRARSFELQKRSGE